MQAVRHLSCAWLAGVTLFSAVVAAAKEDIEFASEHIAEVGLENRLALLPVWGTADESRARRWSTFAQVAYTSARSDSLAVDGPMLALALHLDVTPQWKLGAFAFHDRFELTGNVERRPLQTLFAPEVPLARPVQTQFTGLDGASVNTGFGLMAALHRDRGWLGEHRWVAGISWQRVELRDFDYEYQVLEGPDAGTRGSLDFSATYHDAAGFVGFELLRHYGNWTVAPHVQFTLPTPRRGFAGRITGPGFDLAGDSASAGNGAHFGDSSVSLGLQVTYRPAHLTIDLGSTAAQAVLLPISKSGIDRNLVICVQWSL